jgi:transposase
MVGFALDPPRRAKVVRYLLLQWRPDDIAREVHCHVNTIYNLRRNLWMYGMSSKSSVRTRGSPHKMTKATEDLLQFLTRNPLSDQGEMGWFIWEECGIRVSQPTISRFLKRVRWSRKKARRVSKKLYFQQRLDYLADMAGISAEQMVFLDETIFNEATGWRLMAWAPIGQNGRYTSDRKRGHTWSV